MFRIVATMQIISGELHYHVRLLVKRDVICGILTLRRDEWVEFLKLCEDRRMEVSFEPSVSITSTETCATE